VPDGACDCHVHVFGPFDRFPLDAGRSYTPDRASVAGLCARHQELGVRRAVLVQPSPYGTDNSCLLDALGTLGEHARGVAVLALESDLDAWHRAGVRGVRVNLYSNPDGSDPAELLSSTAERVVDLGWHVQVFAPAAVLHALAATISVLPVPVVVDHFGLVGEQGAELDALCGLLDTGRVWVKLSAPQRCTEDPDGPEFTAVARRLLGSAPERMLWATDWPHTDGGDRSDPLAVEPFRPVDDGRALARLRGWCDDATWRAVLVDNPARLYGWP
jgi:predicted TIM-barrel fold metal-dependent hydrolase